MVGLPYGPLLYCKHNSCFTPMPPVCPQQKCFYYVKVYDIFHRCKTVFSATAVCLLYLPNFLPTPLQLAVCLCFRLLRGTHNLVMENHQGHRSSQLFRLTFMILFCFVPMRHFCCGSFLFVSCMFAPFACIHTFS